MCSEGAYAISELSPASLERIRDLELACFTNPWSTEDFRRVTRDHRALCVGLWVAEELIGYAIGYVEGARLHLANLAVDPARQRQGWGGLLLRQMLVRAAARGCRRCDLEVRASNSGALALYRRHGFTEVGRHERFYTRPVEGAVEMCRELAEVPGPGTRLALDRPGG